MARIFPSDISRLALSGASSGEIDTLRLLKTHLSDDYTVFHGVHWTTEYRSNTAYGEIDFVIVNRSGEILVIEQKNGPLEETSTGLVKHYGDRSKSVGGQLQRSIENIRQKYAHQNRSAGLLIDYLIYCPDHRITTLNAAALDLSRIVDARSRTDLPARVQSLLGPGSAVSNEWGERVQAFFAQSLGLVPDVSAYVSSQERAYTRLTAGLATLVDKLEFEPYRLRVIGTAGSGKSQLGLHAFSRSLSRGITPLLVCFNRPLAVRIAKLVDPGGTVDTYYGFCSKFVERFGRKLDFEDMKDDPHFWQEVQEWVMAADISDESLYDFLVIDEGQDFFPEWFEILKLFVREGAGIIWLEDPSQNLYGRRSVELPGFVTYRENVNFRTPESIARFIRDTLGSEFQQGNMLPGLGVHVSSYVDLSDQLKKVAHCISELVRSGFSHEEIVVVSCSGLNKWSFGSCDKLGTLPVRRFTGAYDGDGNQIHTEGKIYVDSIYRFKGQQAPAVILADIEPWMDDSERARNILFCGMTRATVRLELIVHEHCPLLPTFKRYA